MLEVVNLACVRGDRRLFSGMNFSVSPGTFVQVTGPNGSGKTSLLRMLCGLLTAEHGEIRWQGANIRALGEEYFSALTYIGHRNGLKEELTSLENLRISSALAGKGRVGSIGNGVGAGGCALDSTDSDAASASQMKIVGMTPASRHRESDSVGMAVRPTTAPASSNTGPPDPPKESRTFVSRRRG